MSSKKVNERVPDRKNVNILEAEKIAIDGLKDILQITINGLNEGKPS
jgi:hypothetical protein